jgi:hypothetical protein
VSEVSTQVSLEIRVVSGGDVGVSRFGSGLGAVRARAILQLFAPKSRTLGNVRLMSCFHKRCDNKQLTLPVHQLDFSFCRNDNTPIDITPIAMDVGR